MLLDYCIKLHTFWSFCLPSSLHLIAFHVSGLHALLLAFLSLLCSWPMPRPLTASINLRLELSICVGKHSCAPLTTDDTINFLRCRFLEERWGENKFHRGIDQTGRIWRRDQMYPHFKTCLRKGVILKLILLDVWEIEAPVVQWYGRAYLAWLFTVSTKLV